MNIHGTPEQMAHLHRLKRVAIAELKRQGKNPKDVIRELKEKAAEDLGKILGVR